MLQRSLRDVIKRGRFRTLDHCAPGAVIGSKGGQWVSCDPQSAAVSPNVCHPLRAAHCLPGRRFTRAGGCRTPPLPPRAVGESPMLDILNENLWRENRQHLTNITDMPFQGCAGQQFKNVCTIKVFYVDTLRVLGTVVCLPPWPGL